MNTNSPTAILGELSTVIRGVARACGVLLVVSAFFFIFGIRTVPLFGYSVPIPTPVPAGDSFAGLFFERMQADLIPESIRLVVTTPLEAFTAQVQIAFALALIVLMPIFLLRSVLFFSDALYPNEQRALVRTVTPSLLLFILGATFAYIFIIPPTIVFLYGYASSLGAETLFSTGSFVGMVVGLMLAVGTMFMTPVAMALLSWLGVVPPVFWVEQWRYALLTLLIFSAIITPDGSGVTMLLVSVPLSALYGVGYMASIHGVRKSLPAN